MEGLTLCPKCLAENITIWIRSVPRRDERHYEQEQRRPEGLHAVRGPVSVQRVRKASDSSWHPTGRLCLRQGTWPSKFHRSYEVSPDYSSCYFFISSRLHYCFP